MTYCRHSVGHWAELGLKNEVSKSDASLRRAERRQDYTKVRGRLRLTACQEQGAFPRASFNLHPRFGSERGAVE